MIGGCHGYPQEVPRVLCIEKSQGNLLGMYLLSLSDEEKTTSLPHISASGPSWKEGRIERNGLKSFLFIVTKQKLSKSYIDYR